MRYINTKTGNIIDTPAIISGEDWRPLKGKKQKDQKERAETPAPERDVSK